jgi:hypothetical protein
MLEQNTLFPSKREKFKDSKLTHLKLRERFLGLGNPNPKQVVGFLMGLPVMAIHGKKGFKFIRTLLFNSRVNKN